MIVDEDYSPESSLLAAYKSGRKSKPSKFPPPTMEYLSFYREEANRLKDPQFTLEFAMYLVEAASTMPLEDLDFDITIKTREEMVLEAQKIVKKLAHGSAIIKTGYAEAQFYLANCYGSGSMGISPDPVKSFHLYSQASKQNHAMSIYRTGVCYEIGTGTKQDSRRAIQFYKKSSRLGCPFAMYKLGMALRKGFMGISKNEREGISWIRRAANTMDEDYPQIFHELGLLYEKKDIMSLISDADYAHELFCRAARNGYANSQYKLGLAYETGTLNCHVNPRRSIAWYCKAAEQGDPESELALSGWYLTGSEGVLEQSNVNAYLWARKAADKGFSKAEYAVGYFFEMGIGVEIDLDEAKMWYKRSAKNGLSIAKQRLDHLLNIVHSQNPLQKEVHHGTDKKVHNRHQDCVIM
ncbi:hypothetical protein BDF14DRAFT_1734029 [Spinellus fusiger]|nr:hypothetical protein BDF14DRAFT_1734029 [Spinellus fusiger]